VIGGGELKIDPVKMEATIKWSTLINFIKVSIFLRVAQCFLKFIESFSVVITPLHPITRNNKNLQWGKDQHKAFKYFK
jgi:hypothetical protein